MPVRLIDSLTTTAPLADIFSDSSVLQAMLQFEVALAHVEARLGMIPPSAAKAISSAADPAKFDVATLTAATLLSATPAIPFVKQFTEHVRAVDRAAAGFVHWGGTSQDVCDTAMMLLLQKVQGIFASELDRLEVALTQHSEKHAHTPMLGRTLMQPATPTTFGLKAAGWLGTIHRSRKRMDEAFSEALVLQFGGASGTLAVLSDRGADVAAALAAELNLPMPDAPWHTHRDRLAALLSACGVMAGALGKTARDIVLLMQPEVGEVREQSGEGRGGSSTMPHKQNPVGCTLTLAAANRTPGLIANYLFGMVQEHERAAGGWQTEWSTISEVMIAAGMAITAMATVAERLVVDAERMRANLDATQGRIFAEKAMILLGRSMGSDVAQKLMEEASRVSVEKNRRLKDVLAGMKEVQSHLTAGDIESLEDPSAYLGSAEVFRQRILAATKGGDKQTKKT